jgi:hypothetical protein
LQIEIIILAMALIISAEERKCTEKDVNSQAKREDSTLEQDIDSKDQLSLENYDLKQKQKEKNKLVENEEYMLKHLEKISEFEGHQDNEQSAKEEKRNQGQQLQDEENRIGQHIRKEKYLNVDVKQTQGEAEASKLQQDEETRIGQYTGKEKPLNVDIKQTQGDAEASKLQQDEETRIGQHTGKEKHLKFDIKQTQGEAEASKLQYDVKELDKNENDGELKEKKHTNRVEATLEQGHKLNSLEEHSDQQTAQNNGLEFRQHDQHLEHPLEGYRVTETGQDEAHQLVSQNDFNHLFNYHGGHNLHHSSNIFEGTSLHKHHDIQTLTLTDEGSLQHHFPVYIPDQKHVPQPAEKPVSFPAKHFVSHPVSLPYVVHKPVPYPVKVPVQRPYFVPVPVEKKVPFAVHVRVPVPQPYTVHVPKPYTVFVEKKVPAPYPVRVEVPVSQPYPVKVNVPVKVSVDRPAPVPAEEPYPVTLQKEVVEKKVPYPVQVRSASSNLRLKMWEERELRVFEEY